MDSGTVNRQSTVITRKVDEEETSKESSKSNTGMYFNNSMGGDGDTHTTVDVHSHYNLQRQLSQDSGADMPISTPNHSDTEADVEQGGGSYHWPDTTNNRTKFHSPAHKTVTKTRHHSISESSSIHSGDSSTTQYGTMMDHSSTSGATRLSNPVESSVIDIDEVDETTQLITNTTDVITAGELSGALKTMVKGYIERADAQPVTKDGVKINKRLISAIDKYLEDDQIYDKVASKILGNKTMRGELSTFMEEHRNATVADMKSLIKEGTLKEDLKTEWGIDIELMDDRYMVSIAKMPGTFKKFFVLIIEEVVTRIEANDDMNIDLNVFKNVIAEFTPTGPSVARTVATTLYNACCSTKTRALLTTGVMITLGLLTVAPYLITHFLHTEDGNNNGATRETEVPIGPGLRTTTYI